MKGIPTAIPGKGFIYRPVYRDRHGISQTCAVWWIAYNTRDGKEVRRSLKTTDQREAYDQLLIVAGKRVTGEIRDAKAETGTIGELLDLLLDHYRGRKTYIDVECRVRLRLRPEFGAMKVRDLSRAHLNRFVAKLKVDNVQNSTVNRYLSNLHKAISLGWDGVIPKFPWQSEKDNVRQGVVEPELYRAMRDALEQTAPHAALALVLAYHTGMRRGEILGMEWSQVDLAKGVIRLKSHQTKNKRPRTAPIYGEMAGFLELALDARNQKWPTCPWVIAHNGARINSLKTAWKTAAEQIGVEGAMFHDLRRTALSNMEDAGLPRSTAMEISGHRTESAYRRYLIGSERRCVAAGRRMDEYFQERARIEANQDAKPVSGGTRQADFGTRQERAGALKN